MATTTVAPLALDASGSLHAGAPIDSTTPEAIATAVCELVQDLLNKEASPVSASVLGQGPRGFAMAMLRDISAGGFLSGTASSEDHADAVVQAVLTALGLADGILGAIVDHWKALGGIQAVSVIGPATETPTAGAHVRLMQTMPAPGRLAAATTDAEYRVLRFPDIATVVQAAPDASGLDEIDASMAKLEALGP
ncbi:MAG: hypothetical protein JO086_08920 [Acidimicrobiia bacterium]|nr:hypothetical protein [Acidimicrobiia bacterium]